MYYVRFKGFGLIYIVMKEIRYLRYLWARAAPEHLAVVQTFIQNEFYIVLKLLYFHFRTAQLNYAMNYCELCEQILHINCNNS